jgi:hypothetical protein
MVLSSSQDWCLLGSSRVSSGQVYTRSRGVGSQPCAIFLLITIIAFPLFNALAAPETWFAPVITETGNPSSSFGSSVACSSEIAAIGHSWFAVGAPDESSGSGRVYIMNPSGVTQTLQAPTPTVNARFGYFISFISDINGDLREDLVVGEPNSSLVAGKIYIFISNGSNTAPFTYCGSQTGAVSFGSFILATSNAAFGSAEIIVSTPYSSLIEAFDVTHNLGSCSAAASVNYQSNGGANSRYGQSISEIDTGVGIPQIQLLVGSPANSGTVWRAPSAGAPVAEFLGVMSQQLGVAVASKADSGLIAYSAPYTTAPGDTIYVKTQASGVFGAYCSLAVPMDNLPDTSAQSLIHLNQVFGAFVGVATGATFSSYQNESLTGGSVALFGAEGSACFVPKQINNCEYDPHQLQGIAHAGGPNCVTTGGAKVLMIGSPGFANNSGRVDIYAEGTQSGAATPCATPTPTYTATPIPTDTPIPEPTATPAAAVTPTPLAVDPRTRNLPPPDVLINGGGITMTIPAVLKGPGLVDFLRRKFKLSKSQAIRAANSALLRILWTVEKKGGAIVATAEQDAVVASASKREIQTRRNQATLRNLSPGQYVASYRFIFLVQKPKKTTILGRVSAKRSFVINN